MTRISLTAWRSKGQFQQLLLEWNGCSSCKGQRHKCYLLMKSMRMHSGALRRLSLLPLKRSFWRSSSSGVAMLLLCVILRTCTRPPSVKASLRTKPALKQHVVTFRRKCCLLWLWMTTVTSCPRSWRPPVGFTNLAVPPMDIMWLWWTSRSWEHHGASMWINSPVTSLLFCMPVPSILVGWSLLPTEQCMASLTRTPRCVKEFKMSKLPWEAALLT